MLKLQIYPGIFVLIMYETYDIYLSLKVEIGKFPSKILNKEIMPLLVKYSKYHSEGADFQPVIRGFVWVWFWRVFVANSWDISYSDTTTLPTAQPKCKEH